ncbi:MAG TPA: MurT ligase domain-containing protein [Roseiflexaceae bacterium]|nr:MurT ligase domain-containing protein [Roseiflexaceae bacterium]
MPNLRLVAAIAAGKAAGLASRVLRAGGGTTLPGVVARRIAPDALRQLSSALPGGVVVVGGTNGKTTTTRMIAAILAADGRRVLHNRAGANLVTGLTATALRGSTIGGRVRADMGLFETDEAALPRALEETQPRLVLLHNLFRDQLDRYGEVDTIAAAWRAALERLPSSATVLLNADDPAVAALGEGLPLQVRYYGLEDTRLAGDGATHFADSQFCRRCGAPYVYSATFYAHIGHYGCQRCGQRRPTPDFRLERLDLDGTSGGRLFLSFPGEYARSGAPASPSSSMPAQGYLEIRLPLPGLYNALNALAAAAAGLLLGVQPARIRGTLESFSAAFGRIERVDAGGKPLLLALIKNPVGASETVRMLTEGLRTEGQGLGSAAPSTTTQSLVLSPQQSLFLLIAINDKHADGTDVSWLWDADFERLAGRVAGAVVSGTRAGDMAVRLKYAGVDPETIVAEPDLARALDLALERLPAAATLYALPTYTAMLELRAELARRGWVRPFWED